MLMKADLHKVKLTKAQSNISEIYLSFLKLSKLMLTKSLLQLTSSTFLKLTEAH
jgi:hypothetical protein